MTAANIAPFIRGAHHLVYRPDGLVRPSLSPDICNCLFDLSDLFFQFFFLLCRNLVCRYNRS